jgi:hypothetical protein
MATSSREGGLFPPPVRLYRQQAAIGASQDHLAQIAAMRIDQRQSRGWMAAKIERVLTPSWLVPNWLLPAGGFHEVLHHRARRIGKRDP